MRHHCGNPDCPVCRDRDLGRAEDFGFLRTEVERRDNVVPLPKRARQNQRSFLMPKLYERLADGEQVTVCKLNEQNAGKVAAWLDANFVKVDGEPRPPAWWLGHFHDYLKPGYDQAVIGSDGEYWSIEPYSSLADDFEFVRDL